MKWTCVIIILFWAVLAEEELLEVKTAQGPVRGRKHPNGGLYTFYNIPYATALEGENKFKAPLPPPVRETVFDATDENVIICPQAKLGTATYSFIKEQENCLIANVFIPDTNATRLPVLVYIHGGGFVIGFGLILIKQMTNLMKDKDLIIVTFNYRLGIHGFLCLGTEDVPGNASIAWYIFGTKKDQMALLRWVKKNIASFGGNPNDITLGGGSAGSASADLLMLQNTEGLFHRVIPESGGNLAAFAMQRDPMEIAKNHAKSLNFTNVDDIFALEKFYKTLSIEILTSDPFIDRTDATFLFGPCMERKTDGALFTESPLRILKNGNYKKVPMLYGFANMEGLLRINYFELWKDKMNENFADFLPADMKFVSEKEKERVASYIKTFYFGYKPIGNENIMGFIDYMSDTYIVYPMLWAAKLQAVAGNNHVHLYQYSFVDKNNPLVPYTNIRGANHGAQSIAVFDGQNESNETPEFREMRKIIRKIWRNFIKTGKPIPKGSSLPAWPAAGVKRSPYMSLGQEVELRCKLLANRTQLWDRIYKKYYRYPVPPHDCINKLNLC